MSTTTWTESVWRDALYGARSLVRTPLLFMAAVLSLGLGIGVNVTLFALVHSLMLRDISAADPERLVRVEVGKSSQVSFPNYRDLRTAGVFADLAGFQNTDMAWGGRQQAEAVFGQIVTANYFDLLGTRAWLGRVFSAAEAQPELAPAVVVVGHGFWQRRLGSDRAIVGRTIRLNDQPFTVLGVLPSGFHPPSDYGTTPQVYLPVSPALMALEQRNQVALELIGRLEPGGTLQAARSELDVVARRLEETYPKDNQGFSAGSRLFSMAGFERLKQVSSDPTVMFLGVLGIVVSIVFLLACANVTGLLLARAVSRNRETAVRLALGASRVRLIRQILTETFVLAIVSLLFGLLLAVGLMFIASRMPLPMPQPLELVGTPDIRIFVYAFVLASAATFLCGLVPALRTSRADLVPALKREQEQTVRRRFTLRNLLVAGQVAISVVLLVTALLFLRSLLVTSRVSPGFDIGRTLTVRANLAPERYAAAPLRAFYQQAMDRLKEMPGVESVSCVAVVPLSFSSAGIAFRLEGDAASQEVGARANNVCPRYFETMGIPIVRGREFAETDREGAPLVAVVNETFARQYYPGVDAIGQRLVMIEQKDLPVVQIVGIVRDSKYMQLGEAPSPVLYRPFAQPPAVRRQAAFVVRTSGAPTAALRQASAVVGSLDTSATVEARTLQDNLSFAMLPSRIATILLAVLGTLGLILACVGLYGTMSFNVSRRRREIGIRMALGATARSVLANVLTDSLVIIGTGLVVGTVLAFLVTGSLTMFLASEVGATDPISFGIVILLLLVIGIGAALPPARRAMTVDPARTLQYE